MSEREQTEQEARKKLAAICDVEDFKRIFHWALRETIWANGSAGGCAHDLFELLPAAKRALGSRAIVELQREWRQSGRDWNYAGD